MAAFKAFRSKYTEKYEEFNTSDYYFPLDWIDTPEKEKEINEALQKAIATKKPFERFAPQWYKDHVKEYDRLIAEGACL